MIHEFAVEPELLVEWSASRLSSAYFAGSFGLGEPRIVSHYPSDWQARALRHWTEREAKATTDEEKGKLELQRQRFLELTRSLSGVMVNRTTLACANNKTWLDNALAHAPHTLPTILARQADGAPPHVLAGEAILGHVCWKLPKAMCVSRDAKALASAVTPLLRCCHEVVFVDPYFHPSRHRPSFALFIDALKDRVGLGYPHRIEILTSLSGRNRPSWHQFKSGCLESIAPLLPPGWSMRVAAVNALSSRGEDVHNRYILTNFGGIVFGVGLNSGAATAADDLSVMSREQYERRWKQYAGKTADFAVTITEDDGPHECTLKSDPRTAQRQRKR